MKIIDHRLNAAAQLPGAMPSPKSENSGQGEFLNAVHSAINKVNRLQQAADGAVNGLATGEVKDLHQTMIAMEKADVSFRFIMEVRNKIIDAYREIMRMQI